MGNIDASGGKSDAGTTDSRNGGAGTIYLKASNQEFGELSVDNRGVTVGEASTPLRSIGRRTIGTLTPYSLSVTGTPWTIGGLIGLRVRPNLGDSDLFTVIDNTANQLAADPEDGDMTSVSQNGATFSWVYQFDTMTVAGGAQANTADLLEISDTLTVDGGSLVSGGTSAGTVTLLNGGQ